MYRPSEESCSSSSSSSRESQQQSRRNSQLNSNSSSSSSSSCSASMESHPFLSHVYIRPGSNPQRLRNTLAKQKRRVTALGLLLFFMLSLWAVTVTVLKAQYPAVWVIAVSILRSRPPPPLPPPPAVVVVESSKTADDVRIALEQLTESKADLDARTKKLDKEVNRQLEKLRRKANITETYSRRPSVHLSLYYSHERTEKAGRKGIEPLRWSLWPRGLSSQREIDVTAQDGVIKNIRVKHAGYYYVYSKVTFRSHGKGGHPGHFLYKNNRCIMKLFHTSLGTAHTSYMQGIFLLRAGDLLSIQSLLHLINVVSTEDTFFGAYRV